MAQSACHFCDRATAEPSIFIDALYHPPIVARIRASVGRDIRAWFEYFKQLCGYAAKLARLGARNDVIAEALWTRHIYLPYEASNPFRLFLDAFPLKAPAVTTTAPASPVALRGRARYEPPPIISEAELFESLARPPRTAAEAAASMAMADECFAQLTRTLECGVKRYVALERNWAEYTSLSWLPAERRTLVETDTECGGHWLSAVQRVVPRHIVWNRPEHAWFGLLEASDFEGLLLFHRQQAATDLTDEIRRRAYEEERAAARPRRAAAARSQAPASIDDFTEWKGSMESAMLDEKTGAARRLQLLKALKGAEPTVEVLQETKIGLTVNALRKDGSEDVRTLASALLQKWKALYRAQKSNDEQK